MVAQYSATATMSGRHHIRTNWIRLQRAQNWALRIATGCLEMADAAELHIEAQDLPIRQKNELISQQFAIACHLPRQPCYQLIHRPPDDRPERRRSMIDRLKPNIQQYLAELPLGHTSYKSTISSIHQDAVGTAIESSSSKLLNGRPPPIATAEQTLLRKTWSMLAQLRTGHSRIHDQYMKRIDPTKGLSLPRLMTPTCFSTALRRRPHVQ